MSKPNLLPSPAPGGGAGVGPRPPRRPFTTGEVRLIAAQYADCTAQQLAERLGRTRQSVYSFLTRHPELRKQGRP